MPRFYFDIDDGSGLLLDDEGIETANLESARLKAVEAVRSIARDLVPTGDRHVVSADIRDESGRVRIKATLTLTIETQPD